jgi:hypothetical protein
MVCTEPSHVCRFPSLLPSWPSTEPPPFTDRRSTELTSHHGHYPSFCSKPVQLDPRIISPTLQQWFLHHNPSQHELRRPPWRAVEKRRNRLCPVHILLPKWLMGQQALGRITTCSPGQRVLTSPMKQTRPYIEQQQQPSSSLLFIFEIKREIKLWSPYLTHMNSDSPNSSSEIHINSNTI